MKMSRLINTSGSRSRSHPRFPVSLLPPPLVPPLAPFSTPSIPPRGRNERGAVRLWIVRLRLLLRLSSPVSTGEQ